MITGQYWKLHDDATLRRIDDAVVRLLTRSGARIEHDGLLGMLEGAGCRVDRPARRARFTERLIRDALGRVGARTGDSVAIPSGWSPRWRAGHGGSFPHLLEWPGGERRLATRQDVIDLARMGHALEEMESVGRVVTCGEVDPRIEPLWTTVQLAKTTDKPIGGGEVFFPEHVEPLVRMGEVLSGRPGDTSLVAACDFWITPLVLDPQQAACFLEKRRFGIRNCPGTMAVSGMSAPVTLAGTIALALAELVAGWVLGYVVAPDLAAEGLVCTGSLDMRTMAACFGSPEAKLQDVAVVDAARRLYGIPVHAVIGYTDAKRPGLEAAFLKMLPLLGIPFGTARTPDGQGLLSAGQDYSPVQHVLDREMSKACERFWGHYELDDETLALDLIEEQLARPSVNFLETAHTLRHFRQEQWYPRWFDRSLWQGAALETRAEDEMLRRIDAYVRDAVRRYEPPALPAGRTAELERILRAAERSAAERVGAACAPAA